MTNKPSSSINNKHMSADIDAKIIDAGAACYSRDNVQGAPASDPRGVSQCCRA